MKPAPFDYLRPAEVGEAVAALAEAGDDARILAGGLSLVPMMNFRMVAPGLVIDIGGLGELKGIVDAGAFVEVGAGVAQAALEGWPELPRRLPLLAAALPHVGHYPTRARGTVGGSIACADPSAELPLALAVLDGRVRLRSARGVREVPARSFFEGALATACQDDEMVVATRWPTAGRGARFAFDEVALRHGDFAIASCAVLVDEERIVVGFGGVADTPVVREWPRLDGRALDDALEALAEKIEFIDDGEGGAGYRRGLVLALGRRMVARAAAGSRAGGAGGPGARIHGLTGASIHRREGGSRGESARSTGGAGTGSPGRPGLRLGADERHRVELVLNGERAAAEAAPRLLLSDFLRHAFGRRGVHVGCEHGVCGACTVRVDGALARSCLLFAVQVEGRHVDTVEGLAGPDGTLSRLQEAFRRHHALQCGYCTPGILMTMTAWLERLAEEGRVPDEEEEVREVLSGHLCRCTGYQPIVAAVLDAAIEPAAAPELRPAPERPSEGRTMPSEERERERARGGGREKR